MLEGVSISSSDGLVVCVTNRSRHGAGGARSLCEYCPGIDHRLKMVSHDFDPMDTFNPDDFIKIESNAQIVKEGQRFRRH